MIKLILAASAILLLAGCAYTDRVQLKHPDGRVATCGPYQMYYDGSAAVMQERACVQDFQIQGFQRVS